MTERLRTRGSEPVRRTNPAVLIIGVVFVVAALLGLVYGLGRRLPADAFRFGLPLLLISLGLFGLTVGRPPAATRRRTRRRHSTPPSPRG